MVVIGVLGGNDRFKGTAANILATNELVANLVSQDNAQAMNITCVEAPADVNELELAGASHLSSLSGLGRIAESRVAFECRVLTCLVMGPRQMIVVG